MTSRHGNTFGVTGLCDGNPLITGSLSNQRTNNVSSWHSNEVQNLYKILEWCCTLISERWWLCHLWPGWDWLTHDLFGNASSIACDRRGYPLLDVRRILDTNENIRPRERDVGTEAIVIMMTSSNRNIFRVTGPLCGEFTGPDEYPTQRPVTRSFDVFFDLRLNKRLSKQPWGWWFETPLWWLWRQCNV